MSSKAKGFSLVELMVAILLGALLMLGVVQVFSGVKRSDSTQQAFSRVQESARMAMEMMARDIRAADYWGCFRQRDTVASGRPLLVTNRMDTADTDYISWITAPAISGNNNVTTLTIGTKSVLAGTDTILLKTSTDLCAGQGRVVGAVPGALTVDTSCQVAAGQAALVTTCSGGELFTVTSVAAGVIGHNTTYNTGQAIKNSSAGLNNYGAEAKILAPLQRIYFIATGVNGSPSLFRSDNSGVAEELVPGVEDLQILYGEDTNATPDGAVDKYSTAAIADMNSVVSAKITVTVRSDERVSGDGLLRKSLTTIADIRNRSLK